MCQITREMAAPSRNRVLQYAVVMSGLPKGAPLRGGGDLKRTFLWSLYDREKETTAEVVYVLVRGQLEKERN